MAYLVHNGTGTTRRLGSRQVVGRSSACQFRIEDPTVSGEHAAIAWDRGRWVLRDLSSRNGTWIDGKRLTPGHVVVLSPGMGLGFGAASPAWRVASVAAPRCLASAADQVRESDGGLLALPDEGDPHALVFATEDGEWCFESETARHLCQSGDVVVVRGVAWTLDLPQDLPSTLGVGDLGCPLSQIALSFRVSEDEEHVELRVQRPDGMTDLGARAHHYFLLTLARARLQDREQQSGRPSSWGWRHREDLVRMMRLEPSSLNVTIHRARKQLTAAGIRGAAGIIERRSGSGQLRLADVPVYIEPF